MKKILNNSANKIIMLLSFTIISMQAWASSDEPGDTLDYSQIVNRPDFWIGVVVFIGFITAALMLGREKKGA
jgi:hypothetical protein